MKKVIIILFLAALTAGEVLSDSNPHDSLLMDGAVSVRTETYYSKSLKDCEFRVTYVKGNVTGKIKKTTVYESCGVLDSIYEFENGALKKSSIITGGEPVKTGPESTARIELSDGSVIVLGPNTDYTLPYNACDILKKSFLESGSLWFKIKKLIGGGKFEISTHGMAVGVRGTEFAVEIIEENGIKYDVTKVYEGSVEVSLIESETKTYEDKGDKIKNLTEDFQAGKITYEEFSKALTNERQKEETANTKLFKIVELGYKLKTDGKDLSEPVPFNTSEDTWFIINE